MHDTVRTMVEVDPEAFGLDAHDAPRLGCATTGQLLTELDARLGPRFDLGAIRNVLTGAQLAYRTIDLD